MVKMIQLQVMAGINKKSQFMFYTNSESNVSAVQSMKVLCELLLMTKMMANIFSVVHFGCHAIETHHASRRV